VRVTSTPDGALVVDTTHAKALGFTPLDSTVDRGRSPLELSIEKEGFVPGKLTVPLDGDSNDMVVLRPKHNKHVIEATASDPRHNGEKTEADKRYEGVE
jgi:hypothetical protein